MSGRQRSQGNVITDRGHGRKDHPIGEQIAAAIFRLGEAYLGNAYRSKRRRPSKLPRSSMRWLWRFLNAWFGSLFFFLSALVVLAAIGDLADQTSGIVGTAFRMVVEVPAMSQLAALGNIDTLAIIVVPAALAAVVTVSIKNGGPLRLFVAGVIVSSLPYAIIGGRMANMGAPS